MGDEFLFPIEALKILRQVQWNPDARCFYDGMSGGLVWDDEFPRDSISACVERDSWAFRAVLGYRASLMREEPRDDLKGAWEQLLRECGTWPGFRLERRSTKLLPFLDAEEARLLSEIDAFNDKTQGMPNKALQQNRDDVQRY